MNAGLHGTGRVLAAFALLLFALFCNVGVAWAQTVSIADSEGNPDTGVVFTVTLSGTVGAAKARVDYRTVERRGATAIQGNQGCTPGADYPRSSGRLSFPAGSGGGTTRTFTVRVCGDRTFPDSGYWFRVQLENAAGVSISGGSARGTIRPVGATQAGLTFDPESVMVDEGGMGSYAVVLDRQPTGEVTVRLSVEPEGVVEISPEELTYDATDWDDGKTVTVTGSDDGDIDDEMVVVTHGAEGGGYNGISGTVNVTVDDDDTTPVLSEREVLEVLYDETGGDSWTNSLNWSSNIPDATDLGTLHGVAVSNGRVSHLDLAANQLSGTIPAELGQLTNLTGLHLQGNELSGTIPAELGQLTNLTGLYLHRNYELSGTIPAELGQLTNLMQLWLGENRLSGTIPEELGQLTNLIELLLNENELSGTIPEELAQQLTNLTWLQLYRNQLSGTIPTELGSLTGLSVLGLFENELSGTIPAELAQLTGLTQLQLYENELSGTIPTELGQLTGLTRLRLNGNELSGTIPAELAQLTNLTWLYIHDNQLSGTIPTELGDLTGLTRLRLHGNQLSGEIPAELAQLTNLTWLLLNENELSGSIPTELGQLTNLLFLYLRGNQLTGSIPEELGDLTNLRRLFLNGNQLTGSIPTELESLAGLQYLYLHGNELSGSIPTELGDLTSLLWLYLNGNQLTGTIPTELGQLTSLQRMYLNNNQLTGMIPLTELEALATTHNLQDLALWGNGGLTGSISSELGKRVDRAALRFLYEINGGSDWTNSQNWLSNQPFLDWHGVDVNSDGRVSVLNLADNNLSGEITNALEALEGLETLNLADNRELAGELPVGLMNLSGLTTLNIRCTGISTPATQEFQTWLQGLGNGFTGPGCQDPQSPPPPSTQPPTSTEPPVDTGPDQPDPTPGPDQPGPTPGPDQPGPTPGPDQPGPTPGPDQPGPTPDPDQPDTTPDPDQPDTTPGPDSGDMSGGGGCAIAFDGAEAGRNATESTMFNLLLVVSAILAISLRNRAREKRV